MRRTITEPADVRTEALAELKSWLGITRPNEDGLLEDLLLASIDTCEAFIGQAPVSQMVEERIPAIAGHAALSSRPATALVTVEAIAQDGARSTLDAAEYDFSIDSEGNASIRLNSSIDSQSISVRFQVGMSETWADVPAAIKQGLIRLAAFYYRDRDVSGGSAASDTPPASVSALWRPWRMVRLT